MHKATILCMYMYIYTYIYIIYNLYNIIFYNLFIKKLTKLIEIFIISERYCMSQKIEKPILSGQRIKTRKRGMFKKIGFLE